MKKLLVVCLVMIIAVSSNALTQVKPKLIKFCAKRSEPFIIVDQNYKISGGFDVDIVKAMCDEIGAECKLIAQQQIISLVESLNSGECDAWIAGITIIQDRKKYMDFTNPYYQSSANLIVSKNSTITSSKNDIKNKKIGVVDGSNFENYIEATYGNGVKIMKFANEDSALIALKLNKIDVVAADTAVLQYWLQKNGNENFRLISLLSTNEEISVGVGYGIPVKKGNIELITTLNNALDKIKANEKYDKIVRKYFPKFTNWR